MSTIEAIAVKVKRPAPVKRPVRKPRPKPVRRLRLSEPIHASGARLLVLTVDQLSVGYHLEPMPCEFGRGFKITKFAEGGGDADEDTYLVNIDPATGNRECSCKGNAYCGHCKHTDALAHLIANGRL
jgi:hypothetical protein